MAHPRQMQGARRSLHLHRELAHDVKPAIVQPAQSWVEDIRKLHREPPARELLVVRPLPRVASAVAVGDAPAGTPVVHQRNATLHGAVGPRAAVHPEDADAELGGQVQLATVLAPVPGHGEAEAAAVRVHERPGVDLVDLRVLDVRRGEALQRMLAEHLEVHNLHHCLASVALARRLPARRGGGGRQQPGDQGLDLDRGLRGPRHRHWQLLNWRHERQRRTRRPRLQRDRPFCGRGEGRGGRWSGRWSGLGGDLH
mmetsp:Transcript_94323/g.305166  ORF Transcript_94323/g.305166 Transcript_94323/m.305166 type:complete len:255 (+) Transcript_94323:1831-2595(+)